MYTNNRSNEGKGSLGEGEDDGAKNLLQKEKREKKQKEWSNIDWVCISCIVKKKN